MDYSAAGNRSRHLKEQPSWSPSSIVIKKRQLSKSSKDIFDHLLGKLRQIGRHGFDFTSFLCPHARKICVANAHKTPGSFRKLHGLFSL